MRFEVKAVDPRKQVVALELEAASEALARDLAGQRGYAVLSIAARSFGLGSLLGHRARFPAVQFSIELLALLEAGLNLVEALQALSKKGRSGEPQRVLGELLKSLFQGERFSQALGRFPEHFSPLYVATVKSSERTGNLKEALSRFIAYEEEFDRVRKKVVSAAIYPAILIVVGSLVLAFLMFYVVPRFARVYDDIRIDLPFFSKLLLTLGHWIEAHGALAIVAVIALVAGAIYAVGKPAVRAWANERLWRLPLLGERMRIYQLARLYRTVGMLLRAGVPIVQATDMVQGLLAFHLREQLAAARTRVERGEPLSTALAAVGLATPLAKQMMLVGERGGQMGEMLERIARFHDDETARAVDAFVRVFEPVLMAFLGAAVGIVVVLMYMPIFELAGSIQ